MKFGFTGKDLEKYGKIFEGFNNYWSEFMWETSMTPPEQHSDSRFRYLVHAVWPQGSTPILLQKMHIVSNP